MGNPQVCASAGATGTAHVQCTHMQSIDNVVFARADVFATFLQAYCPSRVLGMRCTHVRVRQGLAGLSCLAPGLRLWHAWGQFHVCPQIRCTMSVVCQQSGLLTVPCNWVLGAADGGALHKGCKGFGLF